MDGAADTGCASIAAHEMTGNSGLILFISFNKPIQLIVSVL